MPTTTGKARYPDASTIQQILKWRVVVENEHRRH
jgi:hypothetical protein